jgi:hypothetical protein
MKPLITLLTLCLFSGAAHAQVILADNYNVTASSTGFALDAGVNTGINPPVTRLTGTAAENLRYMERGNRGAGLYTIAGEKLQVTGGNAFAAITFSADGSSPFDFASVLGSLSATPSSPVTYDLSISMANNLNGATPRFSFAIGTSTPVDGDGQAGLWDFGLQLHRNVSGGTAYSVSKRIDSLSGEGLADDDNTVIASTLDGTYGSEMSFVIRVTDAGAETSSYSSRIQVSTDGGNSFTYDSDSDPLITGFRFDEAGRYIMFDVAGNGSNGGTVTYDNLQVAIVVPEPGTLALAALGTVALLLRRRSA